MTLVDDNMARWLHGAIVDPDGSQIPERIGLAKAAAASATPAIGVDLASYAHGQDNHAETITGFLIAQAPADSNSFELRGALLSRRIAAAVLLHILETRRDETAVASALAIAAATFSGLAPSLAELSSAAESALANLAQEARIAAAVPTQTLRERVDAEFKTLPAQDAGSTTNEQLRAFLSEVRAAVRALAEEAQVRNAALATETRRTSEEIDMLWWVLDPQSDRLGLEWSGAGLGAVVATGIEIARRLTIDPPPRGAEAFARRALSLAGVDDVATSLAAVAAAASPGFLDDNQVFGRPFSWSRPVLGALRAQRPVDGEAQKTSIELGGMEARPCMFALQLIRDISLERVLNR